MRFVLIFLALTFLVGVDADCVDDDQGRTDKYGGGCEYYDEHPSRCGRDDDEDFVAKDMCCSCKTCTVDSLGNSDCPKGKSCKEGMCQEIDPNERECDLSKVEGLIYIGCYTDDHDRDLQEGPMERGYGQVSCNNACKDYKYFALQDNDWCVCGDAYATETKYVKKPDAECGSNGRGAEWRNSIYHTCQEARCFVTGDGVGGSEQSAGTANNPVECLFMAMARGANGATFANGDGPGECYAEFGMTASNGNTDWITCLFGTSGAGRVGVWG